MHIEAIKEYIGPFQRIAGLYIQSGKLTLTKVMTGILTAVVIAFICLLFVIISLALLSYGAIEALSLHMSSIWAYLIVGGFYLILIVLMIVFRRTIIINPIARSLSKIILDAPDNHNTTGDEEEQHLERI